MSVPSPPPQPSFLRQVRDNYPPAVEIGGGVTGQPPGISPRLWFTTQAGQLPAYAGGGGACLKWGRGRALCTFCKQGLWGGVSPPAAWKRCISPGMLSQTKIRAKDRREEIAGEEEVVAPCRPALLFAAVLVSQRPRLILRLCPVRSTRLSLALSGPPERQWWFPEGPSFEMVGPLRVQLVGGHPSSGKLSRLSEGGVSVCACTCVPPSPRRCGLLRLGSGFTAWAL